MVGRPDEVIGGAREKNRSRATSCVQLKRLQEHVTQLNDIVWMSSPRHDQLDRGEMVE